MSGGAGVAGLVVAVANELLEARDELNRLDGEGIRVHRVWVGEYATSLEMAGASLTLLRLDDELKRLVDAPAETPFFVQA